MKHNRHSNSQVEEHQKKLGIKNLVKDYKRHASDAGDRYMKMKASGSEGQEQLEVAEEPN